jgi:hypothetical protein
MRKFKNCILGLLGTVLVITSICGCGNGSSNKISSKTEEKKTALGKNGSMESIKFKADATIAQTVLVDKDGIKVTAQELVYTGNTPSLKLLIENNTSKNLSFKSRKENSVNGFMIPTANMQSDVTAGNKAYESIRFDYEELELYGINQIAEMQIGFDIMDDDYNDVLTVDPVQIKTNVFDSYDLSENTYRKIVSNDALLKSVGFKKEYFSKDTIYDDGGVKADTVFAGTNSSKERVVFIEGYNTGDSQVYMCISDIEVNGIVVSDGLWDAEPINAKKYSVMDISLDHAIENSKAGINAKDVNEIKFKIGLEDVDGNDVASEKEVTISLKSEKNEQEPEAKGEEVYNKDGVKISYMGMKTDSSRVHFVMYIENKSGKNLNVDTDGVSVNGFMESPIDYARVEDGKTGSMDIQVANFELEDSGVKPEEITEAEFTFKITDDDYNDIASPVVKVKVAQ